MQAGSDHASVTRIGMSAVLLQACVVGCVTYREPAANSL